MYELTSDINNKIFRSNLFPFVSFQQIFEVSVLLLLTVYRCSFWLQCNCDCRW